MSRTRAHKPFAVAFTPDEVFHGPRKNTDFMPYPLWYTYREEIDRQEANKHFDRPAAIRREARRLNRAERLKARASLRRGDFELPTMYSTRHRATWNVF